jgi:hypothetical protein
VLELGDGGVVAGLVDEVGEAAEIDEAEASVDSPVDRHGGELCGVHDVFQLSR